MSLPGDRRQRLDSIADVSRAMRSPMYVPDMTESILARVESRRSFLSRRTRKLVWATRAGVAFASAAVVFGVVQIHRHAPQVAGLDQRPAPLTTVVSTAQNEAAASLQSLRSTLSAVADESPPQALQVVFAPAALPAREPASEQVFAYVAPSQAPSAVAAPVYHAPSVSVATGFEPRRSLWVGGTLLPCPDSLLKFASDANALSADRGSMDAVLPPSMFGQYPMFR